MLVFLLIAIACSKQGKKCYIVDESSIIINKPCTINSEDYDIFDQSDKVFVSSLTTFNVSIYISQLFLLDDSAICFNKDATIGQFQLTLGAKIILNDDIVVEDLHIFYDSDYLFDKLFFRNIQSNGKTIKYKDIYLVKFRNYVQIINNEIMNSPIFTGSRVSLKSQNCAEKQCILTINDVSYNFDSQSELESQSESKSDSKSSSQSESQSRSSEHLDSSHLESSHSSQEKSSSVNIPEPEPEVNYFTLSPICIEQDNCLVYKDGDPANCLRGLTSINGNVYPCFKPYDFNNWFYIKNNQIWIVPDNNIHVINDLFLKDSVGEQVNVNTRYTPETHCFYVGYEDDSLEKLCTSKYTLISNSCFRYTRIPAPPKRYCVGQTYNGRRLKFVGQSRF